MFPPKNRPPGKRLIWRVTPDAPHGEYIDPDRPPPPKPVQIEAPEPGWLESSFALADGLDVNDDPDSVPPDVFDELFKR